MLLDDVGSYLAANVSGLSIGSTGNVFKTPLPETAPSPAVQIIEYAGLPSDRGMGAQAGAPIGGERLRFQIMVRDVLNNFSAARALAQSIVNTLDFVSNVALVNGGTRYLHIQALGQPAYIGEDTNARHRFVANFEARKERG